MLAMYYKNCWCEQTFALQKELELCMFIGNSELTPSFQFNFLHLHQVFL